MNGSRPQSPPSFQEVKKRGNGEHAECVDCSQYWQRVGPFVHVRRSVIVRRSAAERLREIDDVERGNQRDEYQQRHAEGYTQRSVLRHVNARIRQLVEYSNLAISRLQPSSHGRGLPSGYED